MVQYRSIVVKDFRKRLVEVLGADSIYYIFSQIGQVDLLHREFEKTNAMLRANVLREDGGSQRIAKDYLLANWNDEIRDLVMKVIANNIDMLPSIMTIFDDDGRKVGHFVR